MAEELSRAEQRRQLGEAATFTPTEAARMLAGSDSENLAWLRREGLIVHGGTRPMVIWGDVLKRLRGSESAATAAPKPPTFKRKPL